MKYYRLLLLFCCLSGAVEAKSIPHFYCKLAKAHAVPPTVVFGLAVTESATKLNDGQFLPWPYTINYAGKSLYFPNQLTAIRFAQELIQQGKLSFDVGFFQVNWFWEGQYYVDDVSTLFDTSLNGDVAMSILKKRKKNARNWEHAAGLYHNPANKNGFADIYEAKFKVNSRRIKDLYTDGCV
ncbi:hypothetical protein [Vibrio rotiferianus]|uniref:hypothetical protein n=1 Tax=Vibrio rotiferianus TaxID=190895 RepID=UPI0005EDFDB0|nr:hypothetical protein [Vibrio rotiferianus]